MIIEKKSAALGAAVAAITLIITYAIFGPPPGKALDSGSAPETSKTRAANGYSAKPPSPIVSVAAQSVDLSPHEFAKFKVTPAAEHDFKIQREAVGNIDFNQDMSVPVFAPFPGRIITLFAKAGDDVKKGQPLFTIDSPDLIEVESKLVSAAGTLELTKRTLTRATQLFQIQGVSQKDLDQSISEHQAAEAAWKAARNALRIFGKTDAEMDRIVADRKLDSVMVVNSPITGRVTARNAAPGAFVQPGTAPSPYTVADVSTMWMLANVAEADFPLLALGQDVDVAVRAYPEHFFRGKVVNIGAAVDPNTRRIQVRSEVRDPSHKLRPGMFATFIIQTGRSVRSIAVPYAGVVREGDGTMSVWVATGERRLTRRAVKVGMHLDGLHQILEGLKAGERIATENALFLNNALTAASR